MRSWQDFDLVQLALMPMFLFSTTFFPLSVYPRGSGRGRVSPALPRHRDHARAVHRRHRRLILGHLAYFVVMAALGWRSRPGDSASCCCVSPAPGSVGDRAGRGAPDGTPPMKMVVLAPGSISCGAAWWPCSPVQIAVSALAGSGDSASRGRLAARGSTARCCWPPTGPSSSGARSISASSAMRSTSCSRGGGAGSSTAGPGGGCSHRRCSTWAGSWPSGPAGCCSPSCRSSR